MEQADDAGGLAFGYRYAGRRLTPSIMADLARILVKAPVFQRSTLGMISGYHVENGGVPTETDIKILVKKAVNILRRKGMLEGAGKPGWWRWRADSHVLAGMESETVPWAAPGVLVNDELDVTERGPSEGEGSGCVYVYYFPTYKNLALRKQEARWPVKVGMTSNGNFRIRVTSQQGTSMPEAPVVGYVRRTTTPRKLEQALHAILHCRGQQLVDAPGAEWFLSSPDEIREIMNWVYSHGLRRREGPK